MRHIIFKEKVVFGTKSLIKYAHMDPLEVFCVIEVDSSIAINRVNSVEGNGKGCAAPDKGKEE